MQPEAPPVGAQRREVLPAVFAGLFGAFLGLSLLKFGNPPITEKCVTAPTQFYEFVFGYPWPIAWAYGLLLVPCRLVARWKPGHVQAGHVASPCQMDEPSVAPGWLVALPLVWLVWQFIAGTRSADPALTDVTVKHFAACVVCFYLGYFSLSRGQPPLAVLGGLARRLPAGAGRRLGTALRRPGGIAPLLLPLRLSPR